MKLNGIELMDCHCGIKILCKFITSRVVIHVGKRYKMLKSCFGILLFWYLLLPTLSSEEPISSELGYSKLQGLYKKAEFDQREEIVDAILELNNREVVKIYKIIKKESTLKLKRHLALFRKISRKKRKKVSKAQMQKVEKYRKDLKQLRYGLMTKDLVKKIGDPALTGLKEMLWLDRETVYEEQEDLEESRKKVLVLNDWEERCIKKAEIKIKKSKKYKVPKFAIEPEESTNVSDSLVHKENLILTEFLPVKKSMIKVLYDNSKLTEYIDKKEAEGVLDLNIMRLLLGMSPLSIDVLLCYSAREHSNDMKTKKFFAHESPLPGKKSPSDRAKRYGTKANAENIAHGAATPQATNKMWWYSPGHHKNMLNEKLKTIGLGRTNRHYTQVFR